MSNKENILRAYKTLAKFVVFGARGQPPIWPFSIIETNWYYTKFFPYEIYHTIKELEEKGIDIKRISKLCWGPSAISHWFYIVEPTLGDPKLNPFEGLTKKEGREFIEKTIELLTYQRKGDNFCRDMKNIILSQNEVDKIYKEKEFLKVNNDSEIKKILHNLTTILWHYTILIQAGHRAYSQEFHGPYDIGKGKSLVVKEFFNLKPGVSANDIIWRFSSKIPYEEIKIFEIYKNSKIEIDMFNHYKISGEMVNFCITGDSNTLSKKELKTLLKICTNVISEGNKTIKNFSSSDWVEKIINLRYLWLKPHKDILGKDWKPPRNIFNLTKKINEAKKVGEQFEKNIIPLVSGLSPNEVVDKIAQLFVNKIF